MVVSNPVARQGTVAGLAVDSLMRVLAALCVGFLLWLLLLPCLDVNRLLLLVMANQLGFLLAVSLPFQKIRIRGKTILAGVCVMLAAVVLGVGYDLLLRYWFGAGTPTIGPWREVRKLNPLPASVVLAMGVLIGPAAEERFFRGGLFGDWQAAGWPWIGAALSSMLFALARLDLWNLPAYFCLGMLLCGAYRCTNSLLAVWLGHALLNGAMFAFLFLGYE